MSTFTEGPFELRPAHRRLRKALRSAIGAHRKTAASRGTRADQAQMATFNRTPTRLPARTARRKLLAVVLIVGLLAVHDRIPVELRPLVYDVVRLILGL